MARTQQKAKASLRYIGDKVDPVHVTAVLGLQATNTRAKGEIWTREPERRYPRGSWLIDSTEADDRDLSTHLSQLLDLLEPRIDAIKQLAYDGYKPNFFCGVFFTGLNGYVALDPGLLRRIADLGASIDIHIYDNGDESSAMDP